MHQICKRFRMHVPVLDCHLDQFGINLIEMGINPCARLRVILLHFFTRRPVVRGIRGGLTRSGIDAALKEAVEGGVKCRRIQAPRRASKFQSNASEMAEVKNEPVPLCNGSVINRRGIDQAEQIVCFFTRMGEFRLKR